MSRSDDLKKQVNELWKQAIDQLEEVKEVIARSTTRFEADLQRLRLERDKLLKLLGEQTYRLANQGKFPVPVIVKNTVDRLNEVIDAIVSAHGKRPAKKKKTGTKKVSRKKSSGA